MIGSAVSGVPTGPAGSPLLVFVSAGSVLGALNHGSALLNSGRSGWKFGHGASALGELVLGIGELRAALASLQANPSLAPDVGATPAELERYIAASLCIRCNLLSQVERDEVPLPAGGRKAWLPLCHRDKVALAEGGSTVMQMGAPRSRGQQLV